MAKKNPPSKVTQIWCQNVHNLKQSNLENRWGLGDLIRGTASIHAACCELGLDFELDYSNHPIVNIFNYEFVKKENGKEREIIFVDFKSHKELVGYIKKGILLGNDMEFMSNGYGTWNEKYVDEFRDFIRPRLQLRNEYAQRAGQLLPTQKPYEVLHFRLGDSYLIEGSINIDQSIIKCLEKNIAENTFLITDSIALKKLAIENYRIKTLPVIPSHFGLHSSFDRLFYTQLEFILMGASKKIKTFSVYPWISGFAKAASFIYDVPLVNLNKRTFLIRTSQYLKRRFF
jgi:hypothetical protein